MTKYHINKHGVPAPCRAQKGNCPYGGEGEHFDSAEAAQNHIDKVHASSHGLLPGVNSENKSTAYRALANQAKQGELKKVEQEMLFHRAEDLEGAYNVIQSMRDESGSVEAAHEKHLKKVNGNFKAREEIIDETMNELRKESDIDDKNNQDNEKIKKLKDELKHEEEANQGDCPKCGEGQLVERNSRYGAFLGCNNFPKCKHTQKVQNKTTNHEKKIQVHKYNIDRREQLLRQDAEKAALNKDKYKKLNEEYNELNKTTKVIDYIRDNERKNKSSPYPRDHDRKTPIEEHYNERKALDDKIQKQIGDNELVWNSGQMKYGSNNTIEANITANEDGQINNLYFEDNAQPGKVRKVTKISDNGEIHFDDGEKKILAHYYNWNMSRPSSPPQSWKFYTTEPSGEEYKGSRNIQIVEGDTSG